MKAYAKIEVTVEIDAADIGQAQRITNGCRARLEESTNAWLGRPQTASVQSVRVETIAVEEVESSIAKGSKVVWHESDIKPETVGTVVAVDEFPSDGEETMVLVSFPGPEGIGVEEYEVLMSELREVA